MTILGNHNQRVLDNLQNGFRSCRFLYRDDQKTFYVDSVLFQIQGIFQRWGVARKWPARHVILSDLYLPWPGWSSYPYRLPRNDAWSPFRWGIDFACFEWFYHLHRHHPRIVTVTRHSDNWSMVAKTEGAYLLYLSGSNCGSGSRAPWGIFLIVCLYGLHSICFWITLWGTVCVFVVCLCSSNLSKECPGYWIGR